MKVFGLHWILHLIYLAIVFTGYKWGQNQLKQQNLPKIEIAQVQELALPVVIHINSYLLDKIDKGWNAYPNSGNMTKRFIARQSAKLINNYYEKCEQAKQDLKDSSRPDENIDQLLRNYNLLADSIKSLFPTDTIWQKRLTTCLFYNGNWGALPQFIRLVPEDQLRLIQNLELKSALALNIGLTNLAYQMENQEFNSLLPVITYQDCPQAGHSFHASISLAPYSRSMENMEVYVDNRMVPIEQGVAHYQSIVDHKAPHESTVKIKVTNPLTGTSNTYVRFGF